MKKSPKALKFSRETLAILENRNMKRVDGGILSDACPASGGCTQPTLGSNPTYNQNSTCGWGATNDWACSLASVCVDHQY